MKFQMKKKGCLVYVCLLCVYLCACGVTGLETESVFQGTESKVFLEQYQKLFAQENAKRAALIYLDEDTMPELLILKDGEYKLYFFDGSEVKAAAMSDTEIKASAYGFRHDFEEADHQTFYWFEYVPYKGLIRVHDGTDQERHDYYLRYADGLFLTELEAKSEDYTWHTYNMEQEITNEDFLSQLAGLGYDRLTPCAFLYDSVESAYENINAASDTGKVLEDFVNGQINALEYVEEIGDIPEDGFVMRSYEDIYEDITCGEEWWGSTEYIDFDNDGEDELILHGYTGSRLFFDVIGDTVYEVLHTGSTTDQAFVTEIDGRKVIARADFLYVGRKSYRIMEYGPCCCLIDWYCLSASYGDKSEYSAEDEFEYRGREITMEEFEERVDGIYRMSQ